MSYLSILTRTAYRAVIAASLLALVATPLVASDASDKEDSASRAAVRMELLQHIGWEAFVIDIDSHGSEVTLSGTVEERKTLELAEEIALGVEGVKEVRNNLKLEGAKDSSTPAGDALGEAERELRDAALASKIKTRLLAEIGRRAFAIEIEAADGTVTLRGDVPDRARRSTAIKVAENTKGVDKVINLIKIEK